MKYIEYISFFQFKEHIQWLELNHLEIKVNFFQVKKEIHWKFSLLTLKFSLLCLWLCIECLYFSTSICQTTQNRNTLLHKYKYFISIEHTSLGFHSKLFINRKCRFYEKFWLKSKWIFKSQYIKELNISIKESLCFDRDHMVA